MDSSGLDVLVYPTWANVPRLVGDYSSPDGAPYDKLTAYVHRLQQPCARLPRPPCPLLCQDALPCKCKVASFVSHCMVG